MSIKERLKEYLQEKGVKIAEFERSIGVSPTYVYKMSSLGSEILAKIKEEYSDINLNWLIAGSGEMLVLQQENNPYSVSKKTNKARFENKVETALEQINKRLAQLEKSKPKKTSTSSGSTSKTQDSYRKTG